MIDSKTIDELASKLSAAIPEPLKNAQVEAKKQFKEVLQSSLSKLDIVTREEFDAQSKVLMRTREKLEALEKKVAELS